MTTAFPAGELNRHQRERPGHKRERGAHCAYVRNANAAYHGSAYRGAKRDADVKPMGSTELASTIDLGWRRCATPMKCVMHDTEKRYMSSAKLM
ncbi:MAG: hypothetical protein ACI38T_01815 [Collinsella sp.]